MKRFVLALAALCTSVAIVGPQAFAQPTPPVAKPGGMSQEGDLPALSRASPAFLKLYESCKGKFDQIQSLISGIEGARLLHDGDSEKLDKLMFEYANDLKASFDQASRDAQEASRSKGERGSVQSLKTFEDLAKQHEEEAKTFEPRITQVQSKIRTGEIKLDKPILQKMSPRDMQQFREFLTPSALREMERLHPDVMKGTSKSSLSRPERQQLVAKAIPIPFLCRVDTFVGDLINDLGPSRAEASLAASCIPPCSQKNWAACASCIVSKGSAAITAWNTFVSCWNGAGTCNWKPWTWPNCAKKAKCLYTLISKLA